MKGLYFMKRGHCPQCLGQIQVGLSKKDDQFFIAEICFCGTVPVNTQQWKDLPTAEFALRIYLKKKDR